MGTKFSLHKETVNMMDLRIWNDSNDESTTDFKKSNEMIKLQDGKSGRSKIFLRESQTRVYRLTYVM